MFFLLLLSCLGQCALYTDPSQLTKTVYDFVVVGGEHSTCYISAPLLTAVPSWDSWKCHRCASDRKS